MNGGIDGVISLIGQRDRMEVSDWPCLNNALNKYVGLKNNLESKIYKHIPSRRRPSQGANCKDQNNLFGERSDSF